MKTRLAWVFSFVLLAAGLASTAIGTWAAVVEWQAYRQLQELAGIAAGEGV